jgi:nitrogen fixation protein NifU and related proteins
MDELYRDYILDHYKNPRNFGELEPHDLEFHDHNPLCGDELGVHMIVDEEGRIAELRFHGQGCAISQAAASITSEELIGMRVEDVPDLSAEWVLEQLGIEVSPTRRKCALLILKVMRGATSGDASWPEAAEEPASVGRSAR